MLQTLAFIGGVLYSSEMLRWRGRHFHKIQRRRFRKLLRHAQLHSPYLADKYRGIDAREATMSDVPVITKTEMMEHFDNIVTDRRITRAAVQDFTGNRDNVGKYFLGKYPVLHTSGSQGQPALLVQDPSAFRCMFAMQVGRGNRVPKTVPALFRNFIRRRRLAIFQLAPGFFPSGATFAYMPKGMRRFTNILRLQYSDPFADNVRKLNDFKPNMIVGYGHVMANLAAAQMEGHLRLRDEGCLELMTSIAEPMLAETSELVNEVFGIHLSSHYSMGECLTLTHCCPYHSGSHVNTDLAAIEVVDNRGRPVPDGVRGDKVRVSNLCNFVQPVIRYEIDDVVTMSDKPCPCGNPLPLIRTVAGRYNDHLWIEVAGRPQQLPTFFFTVAFHPLFDLAEFQVTLVSRNRFEIQAVGLPGRGLTAQRVQDALKQQAIRESLHDTLQFSVRLVDDIPPDSRTGKLRRYVSHVGVPERREPVLVS
jgi:phenylacetate-CoA ligase